MAVEYGRADAIATITLDRPPANSYEIGFIRELGVAVEAARDDAEARVVILRSGSEKFFSAGADITAFRAGTTDANMDMIRASHEVLASIARIPKVFIAEIGGHALGGGLEIALACDLRVGAEGSYRIGLPEVTLGLLPGNGGTQRLPRLIGRGRALELMTTGRTLQPAEALALGILDRLVPAEELREATTQLAATLATGATQAIGSIKLAVHAGLDTTLAEGLALERDLVAALFETGDAKEGLAAFAEKRPASFRGA